MLNNEYGPWALMCGDLIRAAVLRFQIRIETGSFSSKSPGVTEWTRSKLVSQPNYCPYIHVSNVHTCIIQYCVEQLFDLYQPEAELKINHVCFSFVTAAFLSLKKQHILQPVLSRDLRFLRTALLVWLLPLFWYKKNLSSSSKIS